jgi:hypothetical protein
MKVRLIAEEYSRHAPLCARTPTHRADLCRRRLRIPLARCTGDRPHDSVRLRRQAVRAILAHPWLGEACSGHSRTYQQGCRAGRGCQSCSNSDRARGPLSSGEGSPARLRDHTTATYGLRVGRSEGARQDPAAQPNHHTPLATSTDAVAPACATTQSSVARPRDPRPGDARAVGLRGND